MRNILNKQAFSHTGYWGYNKTFIFTSKQEIGSWLIIKKEDILLEANINYIIGLIRQNVHQ